MCEINAAGPDAVAVAVAVACVPARELGPRVLLRSAHVIGGLMPCRNFIASLTFSESFFRRIRGLLVWKCAGIS